MGPSSDFFDISPEFLPESRQAGLKAFPAYR